MVLLEVPAANQLPVQFDGTAYIRIGSATPPLRDYPEREQALLAKLRPFAWEQGPALTFASGEEVLELLDYSAYLELMGLRLPDTAAGILERMSQDRLIAADAGGRWTILNLGAILLARKLDRFDGIARKSLRIIQYNGQNRLSSKPEHVWSKGYAAGFQEIETFLNGILPAKEDIKTFRTEERAYPSEAIKELLANTLIHQDMTITGTGPVIEVFDDRVEFSNPGEPVTDIRKLFGVQPRSRNERLAGTMRRMKLCEERGLGLRRIIAATEMARLLPPEFRTREGSMRVILYGHSRGFDAMDQTERMRGCYQHAAWLFENGQRLTNTSLRDRFGLETSAVYRMSILIRECVDAGLLKVADPTRPKSGYWPFWA